MSLETVLFSGGSETFSKLPLFPPPPTSHTREVRRLCDVSDANLHLICVEWDWPGSHKFVVMIAAGGVS